MNTYHDSDGAASDVLCIDLGGTKCAVSRVTVSGHVQLRRQASTPARNGPQTIIPLLLDLAQEVLAEGETPLGIGISAGAPSDAARGRVFTAPNLPGWEGDDNQGVPLAKIVSEACGSLPTYLENDADATALAEWMFGAGAGTHDMAFLTIGTGIGAGLILDGKLHRGQIGAGGEIGHVAVEPSGRVCTCGLRGCLEAYASGPSIVRVAQEHGFVGEATGYAVIQAARAGEPSAVFAVEQAATMLGRGLATLVMLLNPRQIVLGTLAVHASDLLLPGILTTLEAHTWVRLRQNLSVVPAALGDRAQDVAALCAFLHGSRS